MSARTVRTTRRGARAGRALVARLLLVAVVSGVGCAGRSPPGQPPPVASEAIAVEPAASPPPSAVTSAERELRGRLPEALRCFERELAARPDLQGHIDADVEVAANGAIVETRLVESTVRDDQSVRQCLVDTLSRWQLRQPIERAVVRLRFPWEAGDNPHASEQHGSLDKEMIRLVVRSHLDEVRDCYERALMAGATLAGRVMESFIVAREGRVMWAGVRESSLQRPDVESCITTAITTWRFPPPAGGGIVIVSYPFVLKTQ